MAEHRQSIIADESVVVTGMGFCLPGSNSPACTADDVWREASTGAVNLRYGDRYFGAVHEDPRELVLTRCPTLDGRYLNKYNYPQMYGLVSMAEALVQAGLEIGDPYLTSAAILTGRHGLDSSFDIHGRALAAVHERTTPAQARELIARTMMAGNTMDVFLAQTTLLASTGPSFTVSASCATTGILIGTALQQIRTGEVDIAVVTGADHYDPARMARFQELSRAAVSDLDGSFTGVVDGQQMRPYDQNPGGPNVGNGSVTLVLERASRAVARGATPQAAVLAQSTRRGPLRSAMAVDLKGRGAVAAGQQCLQRAGMEPQDIDYVNGGAEGDMSLQRMEFSALRELFGEGVERLPVSSQEGTFGHSGAPLGALGVALTTMMLRRQELCPTAGCEVIDADCPFDVVTGTQARPSRISNALSFNYGTGMVSSAVLLGVAA